MAHLQDLVSESYKLAAMDIWKYVLNRFECSLAKEGKWGIITLIQNKDIKYMFFSKTLEANNFLKLRF